MPQTSFEWVIFVILLMILMAGTCYYVISICNELNKSTREERKKQRLEKRKLEEQESAKDLQDTYNSLLKYQTMWYSGETSPKSDLKIVTDIIDKQRTEEINKVYVTSAGVKTSEQKNKEFYRAVLRELLYYMPKEEAEEVLNFRLCYDIEQDKSDIIEFFLYEKSVYRGTKEKAVEYARENLHQSNYTTKGNGVYFVEPKEYHKAKAKPKDEKVGLK